jgi:site-specific DNA-methyltransferase (adenine-specific)
LRRTELFHRNKLDIWPWKRDGYLVRADALNFARHLRSEIADLVFVDPPFNLGKDYGFASSIETASSSSYQEYMEFLIRELARVLKPGGALFLYHLPYWASRLSYPLQQHLDFRHWIAVTMKNGFVRGKRLYPAHYALLYYTKGKPLHFQRPRLTPQMCRHCGKSVKDYGGYTNIIRRKGVNLSDFWDDLSPLRHKNHKHRSANQLPLVLTDRIVSIAGKSDGLFIDPFVGSGTSLISANVLGMCFIGNDMSRRNLDICLDRLAAPRR